MLDELDYNRIKGLEKVRAEADAGNIDAALKELVRYFKERHIAGFEIDTSDENYGMAVPPMRGIFTGADEFDTWQGEFAVTSHDYRDYSVNVTAYVKAAAEAVSFLLISAERGGAPVSIRSRESGEAPRLEICHKGDNGVQITAISASHDTYIDSLSPTLSHGEKTCIFVCDNGIDAGIRRGYITFPLDCQQGEILCARIVLSASCSQDATVLVFGCGDTLWKEEERTWNSVRCNINMGSDNLSAIPSADSEYINVLSRFWFGKPMVYEYLSYIENPSEYNLTHSYSDTYPGEKFADRLIDIMSAFAKKAPPGFPRTLDTGERLSRWTDIVNALVGAGAFDERAEDFCNIIAFMRDDCEYLCGLDITDDTLWWSNWRAAANVGFLKASEFLPELKAYDRYGGRARSNLEYTINRLYDDDMSFREAAPSYALWCAELFGTCVRISENSKTPMSAEFKKKAAGAARFAAAAFFPNGYDSNTGDSNHRSRLREFKKLAEIFDDEFLKSYIRGFTDGFTKLYSRSNSLYARSGGSRDESVYISFTNNPFDGHHHADSNQILMYAYGQPLLVDSGRYCYGADNPVYSLLRTARSHNTVEVIGEDMLSHSASKGEMIVFADNDMFVFAASEQHGYVETRHIRYMLFFKKENLPELVVDRIKGERIKTCRQNWHFLPASDAAIDGNTVVTHFCNRANIAVANADNDATATVEDGYFSADYGLLSHSLYASFEKTGTDMTFATFLCPLHCGEREYISAKSQGGTRLFAATSGKHSISASVDVSLDGEGRISEPTDARASFVRHSPTLLYGIAHGRFLDDEGIRLIESEECISLGVIIEGRTAAVFTDSQCDGIRVRLYAPHIDTVTLNNAAIPFTKAENTAGVITLYIRSQIALRG